MKKRVSMHEKLEALELQLKGKERELESLVEIRNEQDAMVEKLKSELASHKNEAPN